MRKCKFCGRPIRLRDDDRDHWPVNGFSSPSIFDGISNPKYRHVEAPKVSCSQINGPFVELDETSSVIEILSRYEV